MPFCYRECPFFPAKEPSRLNPDIKVRHHSVPTRRFVLLSAAETNLVEDRVDGGCGARRSRWRGRWVRGMGRRGRSDCWLKSARDVCVYSSPLLRLLMVLLPPLLLLLRWEDKSFVTTASHPESFFLRCVVQFQSLSLSLSLCAAVYSGSAFDKNWLCIEECVSDSVILS